MKKQEGFTVVEVALVIAFVIAITGVSIFAYTKIQKSEDTKQSVSSEKVDDTRTEKSAQLVYEPADKAYKIELPDGWRFTYTPPSEENENISYLYARTNEMESVKGVKAQVQNQTGGYGPETGFTLSVHKHDGPVGYGEGLLSLEGFQTNQGKQVNVFQDEEATEPFSEPAEGSENFFTQYEYYIVGSNNTVYKFVYNLSAGDTSHKEEVEQTIKTIQVP